MKNYTVTIKNDTGAVTFQLGEIHISDLISDLGYAGGKVTVIVDIIGEELEVQDEKYY